MRALREDCILRAPKASLCLFSWVVCYVTCIYHLRTRMQESLRALREDCALRAPQASLSSLESTVSCLEREHAKTRRASDLTGRFVDWFSSRGQVSCLTTPSRANFSSAVFVCDKQNREERTSHHEFLCVGVLCVCLMCQYARARVICTCLCMR